MVMRLFIMGLTLGILLSGSQVANATITGYEVSITGTWTNTSSKTSQVYCGTTCGANGGSWSISFDLPATLSNNPTFQETNFLFNGSGSSVVSIVNTPGSEITPLGQAAYQGGIAIDANLQSISPFTLDGKNQDTFGEIFTMLTCLSGCNPDNQSTIAYGADLVMIFGGVAPTGTTQNTDVLNSNGNSLLAVSNDPVWINIDDGTDIGNGSLTITALSGTGTGGTGGLAATPEPPTVLLMATGLLGMFGWAGYRRIKAQA